MKLDLTGLISSIGALERLVMAADAHADDLPDVLRDGVRSGMIHDFKVAYEQCWKSMKRWLENHISVGVADGVTRRELFRLAAENLLIEDVALWMKFHEARNETSHTYDQATAVMVGDTAKEFLIEAKRFLNNLQARND